MYVILILVESLVPQRHEIYFGNKDKDISQPG